MLNRSSIAFACCGLVALVAISLPLLAAGPSQRRGEAYFFSQLQARQFYQLAESYCRQRLATESIAANEFRRIEWSVNLIEALTMQAINQIEMPIDEETWKAIAKVRDAERTSTENVVLQGRLELSFQLAQLWRATWLESMASTANDPVGARNAAIEHFRRVARGLESMQQRLEANRPSSRTAEGVNASDWKRLNIRLQYKLAETYQRQAKAYPHGSADHVLLLTQAANQFSRIARLKPRSQITLQSELAEIDCLRLLGKLDDVEIKLRQFPTSALRDSIARQHVVQTAEWLIARGQPESAAQLLAKDLEKFGDDSPQNVRAAAQLALIGAYIEAARKSDEGESASTERETRSASADEWQALAVNMLNKMEVSQSAYWVRKAEALLINRPTERRGASDVEIIAKRANNLYHRKQYEEAVATFQRAATQAEESGLDSRAFDFGFQAAAVLHETKQSSEAMIAFQTLADRSPKQPRAAEAHWLAIINAAAVVRKSPEQLPAYQRLLATHLRFWPTAPTANSAALWLGRLLRQQADLRGAIEALQQVVPTSPQYQDALVELRASYLQALTDDQLDVETRARLAKQAVAAFARPANPTDQAAPTVSSSGAVPATGSFDLPAYATISTVEFQLLFTDADAAAVVKPLRSGPLAAQCLRADRNRVQALLGLASVLSPQTGFVERTREHWQQVRWQNSDWLQPFLRRLSESAILATSRNNPNAAAINQLERELITRLLAIEGLQNNISIHKQKAEGLVRAGDRTTALAVYRQLAAANQTNPQLLADLAALWEVGDSTADCEQALATWRAMARAARDGSDDWFTAKLGIARTLFRLGENKRACESLQLLQALRPNLGGPRLKSQFMKLLANCE